MEEPAWRLALERHAESERWLRHDLANRMTTLVATIEDDAQRAQGRLERRVRVLEDWKSQQQGVRAALTVLGVLGGLASAALVIYDRLVHGF